MDAAILALGAIFQLAEPTTTLNAHFWRSRPIIIFAEQNSAHLSEQLILFSENKIDLMDRRNLVIVDTNEDSQLRDRFDPQGFTVLLVGLDGGEKQRSEGIIHPDKLDALIDTMQIRRRELANK